jgi:hypothetical protein
MAKPRCRDRVEVLAPHPSKNDGWGSLSRGRVLSRRPKVGQPPVHSEISAFYSSAPGWLKGLTVRGWMATQSWEVQWSAGLEIWKQAMTGAITWAGPLQ